MLEIFVVVVLVGHGDLFLLVWVRVADVRSCVRCVVVRSFVERV